MTIVTGKYKAIVIGTSAGGLQALSTILQALPINYPVPLVVVQHRTKDQKTLLEEILQQKSNLTVVQADEKETIKAGFVFIAPPDYHLLIEADHSFSLSAEEPVQYSRPSVNVLFESAADAFRETLVGIILTGSNADGAAGIAAINNNGGLTIAQDPAEARYAEMPMAAIKNGATYVYSLSEIITFLLTCI
jgi:two-component system, chemotaxis family, protein-glutamate methylesterase/glutaminase